MLLLVWELMQEHRSGRGRAPDLQLCRMGCSSILFILWGTWCLASLIVIAHVMYVGSQCDYTVMCCPAARTLL